MGSKKDLGTMRHVIRSFITDESGDDLIEYVLLAMVVGTAGAAALNALPAIMNVVYASWDAGAQSLWEPEDPAVP